MMQRFRFNEGSSGVIEFDLEDEAGDPVPDSELDMATLTLWDLETGDLDGSPRVGIINGRDEQDINNVNHVAIDSDGHLVFTLQPEDNIIVTPRRQVERHLAKFEFAWATGHFTYLCEIDVDNL
jgi:hypothetical protein